jgi:hypothetical protein
MKRIFGIYAIGLIALWVGLSFSCGNRSLEETDSEMGAALITVTKLTQQEIYPGVHSNLVKTRNYLLQANLELSSVIQIKALMVDSIRLVPGFVKVDGANLKVEMLTIDGGNHQVQLNFARNFYGDGPQVVEEFEAQSSGMYIEKGKAKLEIMIDGEVQILELGEITKLESIYAP